MLAWRRTDYFVSRQSFPVQPWNSFLETRVEGSDRAYRSPAAKIHQQRPQHTQRFGCQTAGQLTRRTASSGKEFIYKDG